MIARSHASGLGSAAGAGARYRRLVAATIAGLCGAVFGLLGAITLNAPTEPSAVVALEAPAIIAPVELTEALVLPPAEVASALPEVVAPVPDEPVAVALRIVASEPIPVTVGELYQALARSPWPRELWPEVVRIARCESGWGAGVDAVAEGDSGRSLGVLQIRVDAHRELARQFDLMTIDGGLGAAWVIYQRGGGNFAPWSCA